MRQSRLIKGIFTGIETVSGIQITSLRLFSLLLVHHQTMKIYINHVGRRVTPDSLSAIFSTYGNVSSVSIIDEKDGRAAIIMMPEAAAAHRAITLLNGSYIDGMAISVRPYTALSSN